MDTKPLERIGLSKGEIAVYLSLLRLGQSTAGPIVDDSRVTRSKIYDILERLKQKGLVGHITKNKTKYFSAASPQALIEYLQRKESEIGKDRSQIEKMLPDLLLEQQLSRAKQTAEVFVGYRGMESAFAPLIQAFHPQIEYYVFGAGEGENEKRVHLFFARLQKRREEKKVKSNIIFHESVRGRFQTQEQSPFVKRRYLSHTTPTAINVYGEFVVIAILTQEPITLLLKNREAADSFREYFKTMWALAKN